jgi:hypothetical protein
MSSENASTRFLKHELLQLIFYQRDKYKKMKMCVRFRCTYVVFLNIVYRKDLNICLRNWVYLLNKKLFYRYIVNPDSSGSICQAKDNSNIIVCCRSDKRIRIGSP